MWRWAKNITGRVTNKNEIFQCYFSLAWSVKTRCFLFISFSLPWPVFTLQHLFFRAQPSFFASWHNNLLIDSTELSLWGIAVFHAFLFLQHISNISLKTNVARLLSPCCLHVKFQLNISNQCLRCEKLVIWRRAVSPDSTKNVVLPLAMKQVAWILVVFRHTGIRAGEAQKQFGAVAGWDGV